MATKRHIASPPCVQKGSTLILPDVEGFLSILGYHLVIIPSPTARWNRRTRSWMPHCPARYRVNSWPTHMPWVEYALKTLVSSTTGMSSSMVNHGSQSPLFLSQEAEMEIQAHFCLAQVWQETWATLEPPVRGIADRQCIPVQECQVGQQGWLSALDLPLEVGSRTLVPCYNPIQINRSLTTALSTWSCRGALVVHQSSMFSLLKAVGESPFHPW